MNIDVKMTYLKYLLLAGAMCAFGSCQRENGPLELPAGNPIELSATSDWPKFSKSIIDSQEDLIGDGFVVWGDCIANNTTYTVFESTLVTAKKIDEEIKWDYTDTQYWMKGVYEFAALLPATAVSNNISGLILPAKLVLNEGTIILGGYSANGTELEETCQTDLMYALSVEINNSDNEAESKPVSLTFKHLWAQLGFNLQSIEPNGKSIDVTEIKLYGSGLYKSITFTEETPLTITNVTADDFASITTCLGNTTDQGAPFATFAKPDQNNDDWTVGAEPVALVDKLMVFPVVLSEDNSVIVEVTYGNGKTIKGTIAQGTWLSGNRYIYTLQLGANSINFGKQPTVHPWSEGENFEIDIEINKQENNEE